MCVPYIVSLFFLSIQNNFLQLSSYSYFHYVSMSFEMQRFHISYFLVRWLGHSVRLNTSGEDITCFTPNLLGESIKCFTINYDVSCRGFIQVLFTKLRKFPRLLGVEIMNRLWILLDGFSVSVDRIMWNSFYFRVLFW